MSALATLKRRGLAWLGRPQWHEVGGVLLELPAEHLLPAYQAAHPLYDRFLPHLATRLAPDDAVVDVGANVGDSVAALLAGQGALQVLAIEADAGFHAVLERNAERLRAAYPLATLSLVQAFVGSGAQPMRLEGSGGTRHAVSATEAAPALRPRTLDALLHDAPASFASRLRLIKCDVDGHDHDVLASAEATIAARCPMLFFECQVADAAARTAFVALIERLMESGYAEAEVFDNFGRPLLQTAQPPVIAALIDQVLEQDAGHAPRTLHYLDLLLAAAADVPLARAAVQAHAR